MKGLIKSIFGPVSSVNDSSGWFLSHFGAGSHAGVQVNDVTALKLSPFFNINRAISEDIAKLPKKVFRKLPEKRREDILDHPSLRALTLQPNPLMTAITFYETLQGHVLTHGNAYAEIQFYQNDPGRVKALWPLPPTRVVPEKTLNGRTPDVRYAVTFDDGSKGYLPKERVLHLKGLGFDGLRGYSMIWYAANALGLGSALEEFSSKFFSNGSQSGGYIEVPKGTTDTEIKNMKQHWTELNSGLEEAHRFKFLYDSVKFTPISIKPEEAQFLETRVNQVKEIARFYRMPIHKLQELKDVSYNTVEQLNIEYVNDTLMGWIVKWEQELESKLFTHEEDKNLCITFNTSALLRGDSVARANYLRTLIFSSVLNPNEAREELDYPPYEGGDEYMKAGNMVTESDRSINANERVQD